MLSETVRVGVAYLRPARESAILEEKLPRLLLYDSALIRKVLGGPGGPGVAQRRQSKELQPEARWSGGSFSDSDVDWLCGE